MVVPNYIIIAIISAVISVLAWAVNKLIVRMEDYEKRLVLLEIHYSSIEGKLDLIRGQVERLANYLAANSEMK